MGNENMNTLLFGVLGVVAIVAIVGMITMVSWTGTANQNLAGQAATASTELAEYFTCDELSDLRDRWDSLKISTSRGEDLRQAQLTQIDNAIKDLKCRTVE